MEKKRILIIDDERDLCEILLFNLNAAGYEADAVYSAEEALASVLSYDLLLLDVMMPGMSGFELAERLKSEPKTSAIPIIFLTAKDTEDDTLQGFDLGADDYITKPFSVREVLARVKAVLHRSLPQNHREGSLRFEGLVVDFARKTIVADGEPVELTKTEFELLSLLLTHRGKVLSRQQLLDGAWPQGVVVTDRTVDVNIARLRKKIGQYSAYIVARQGFGYCFEETASS
ncbi:MAG: response regulator transcription factor [Prevotella sp.]|nr:response regulator transcription factor [Prevotella sp.]MBR7042893.1 response regulator transcription factor [Prevotella sp.]